MQLLNESSTVTVSIKDLPKTETQLLTETVTSTVSIRNLPEVFKSETDEDEDYSDFVKLPKQMTTNVSATFSNAEWIKKKHIENLEIRRNPVYCMLLGVAICLMWCH